MIPHFHPPKVMLGTDYSLSHFGSCYYSKCMLKQNKGTHVFEAQATSPLVDQNVPAQTWGLC